jgi:AcrR family transcriptional regulator
VSGITVRDRQAERRQATEAEILEAAWDLVREQGLAALSLRELGARVGMRAQSLYVYFPSKNAIYDAMFAEGNRELLRQRGLLTVDPDPLVAMRQSAHQFVEFCISDAARYQLLFQRTIPGFEPSEASYDLAKQSLGWGRDRLRAVGLTVQADLDLWTGVIGGLVSQQLSNEPSGRRWVRLLDDAIDMYVKHVTNRKRTK